MKYRLLMQIVGIQKEEDFIELDSEGVTIDSINLKFREAGLRPWRFIDKYGIINLFPLDSRSIVRVIAIPIEKPEKEVAPEPITDEQYDEVMKAELPRMDEQKASVLKTNDELLDIMRERSDCKHDFKDLKVGYKETSNGKRYQPYCTKVFSDGSRCTYRGRYVGAQKVKEGKYETTPTPWTIQDLLSAKELPEIN